MTILFIACLVVYSAFVLLVAVVSYVAMSVGIDALIARAKKRKEERQ